MPSQEPTSRNYNRALSASSANPADCRGPNFSGHRARLDHMQPAQHRRSMSDTPMPARIPTPISAHSYSESLVGIGRNGPGTISFQLPGRSRIGGKKKSFQLVGFIFNVP